MLAARSLVVAFLLVTVAGAMPSRKDAIPATSPDRKLSTVLRGELDRFDATAQTQGVGSARKEFIRWTSRHPLIRTNEAGEVLVSLRLREYRPGIHGELAALGALVARSSARWNTVECWVAPELVRRVAAHHDVTTVRPVARPRTSAGSVQSEGDAILHADLVRQMGYDGTGVAVGVMSDGVAGIADAKATGDLPPSLVVLPGYEGPTDGAEGTAMLEIVHDLAPGASLFFASAYGSELAFADGIVALADAGCDVIVDDVFYLHEPMFEDGVIAQGVEQVKSRGVAYFSSAGNQAQEHYQAEFVAARPGSLSDSMAYHFHAWDGQADSSLAIVIAPRAQILVFAQWNDRFGVSANDYDFYLYDTPRFNPSPNGPNFLAGSLDFQGGKADPFEAFVYANASDSPDTVYLAIDLYDGDFRFLSLFILGAATSEYVVSEGSVFGHTAANGALAVAAINANEPGHDDIAYYSSWGPREIYFPARETRLKPDITGIDGVSVTGVGGFGSPFYGTSASAPHVAAVGALLLDARPNWRADEVYVALTTTAVDRGLPGPDIVYGYGLAQADAAVNAGGATTVSDTITTQTWTALNSPYHVVGTITVPSGNTLTIGPGVDILFDADVQFIVQGRLEAIGTETDSIRFLKGTASEWGGIRISGGDSSTIAYARISDGHADGPASPDNLGGGLYVSGAATRLALSRARVRGNSASSGGGFYAYAGANITAADCEFSGNVAASSGGGLCADRATVGLVGCAISGNRAGSYGGGVSAFQIVTEGGTSVTLRSCAVTGNTSNWRAGALHVSMDIERIRATLVKCTIAGNATVDGGALFVEPAGTSLTNCIVWGNTFESITDYSSGTLTIEYSDAQGGYPGTGNINADPLFVDAANGDYRLQPGSPCIDTGDPNSPLDPDGTRADMGAFYFDQTPLEMSLPHLVARPGRYLQVPILVTGRDILSADIVFLAERDVLTWTEDFVPFVAFEGQPYWEYWWSVTNDTVRLSMISDGIHSISLANEPIAIFQFRVLDDAPRGAVSPLVWLRDVSETNINEQAPDLADGSVTVTGNRYGDVSGDDEITSYDASLILQYVVHWIDRQIDTVAADVTGSGFVSSFDAALVMRRVLISDYVFPVEGGPFPKLAATAGIRSANSFTNASRSPRILRWRPTGQGWTVTVDDPAGIEAGEMTFALGSRAPVRAIGAGLIAYRQEGTTLRVAFVRGGSDGPVLFRLEGEGIHETAPRITEARLNEGQVPVALASRPLAFALEQNVPNPFNPATTLRFTTLASGVVNLAVYDVDGRFVRTLLEGEVPAGTQGVVWDGTDSAGRQVSSGVYLYRLTGRHGTAVRKMVLAR